MIVSLLGEKAKGFYHNAGVCLLDCDLWRSGDLKNKCFDFILQHRPQYCDQSALNYCFHGEIAPLPGHFNLHTNVRTNWPLLRRPACGAGCLLHLVDFPKPWSPFGQWIHPFGSQWWKEYQKTSHFNKNPHQASKLLWDKKTKIGYKKALKDKVLFSLYQSNLFVPKGVPRK
jgi:lipopolysaccharide biosynthesis glycosyltransferase